MYSMNTKMHYLYRDAASNKVHTVVILNGEISKEQEATIADCLYNGTYFIPSQVGLPENRFETLEEKLDVPWFELYPYDAFFATNQLPDTDLTVEALVENFKRAKNDWDKSAFSTALAESTDAALQNGEVDYIIAVEGSTSKAHLPALVIDIFGEDL